MTELKINQLSFYYAEDQYVLEDINLTLNNATTAIVGQNGAGKTTLVKLIKGLLKPVSGQILLDGEDISHQTVAQLSSRIGLVFQNPNDQVFKNKVIDEAMFGPLNIGVDTDRAKEQARQALKKVGLEDEEEANPYDLSLSERKMVALASILAMDTAVVIFDEPTMGQDHKGKERIKAIIQGLRQEGRLVLCILHDMDFAADVFERTLVFNQGKLLLDGATADVFADEAVLEAAHLKQPEVLRLARHAGLREAILTEQELVRVLQNRFASR